MYRERGSLKANCGRRERYFPRSIRGIRGRRAGGLRSSSYIYNNVYGYIVYAGRLRSARAQKFGRILCEVERGWGNRCAYIYKTGGGEERASE